ncbi:bifunctional 5,10-methylenetetrahydrofolate dehydrogenase/5,10-methenyltetrahydrofolate cyclohydrolase [Serpentinicella sp. ANB-PHB4]|uniref:bifunctional 5,10-methylenetetrahydrofolate dehydrogenase/5,10-methenyltetrahydrofolate cyclohydrolase n=1 Tax=Serpentinicella sp. ANB-PHB4 TaxID=3074076 RepID=UPI00285842C5|nr:bifunctional 5,10-methylenetetrahydrofolate dehydrogenase/5,10-methenyltetrahydrofolate cyclohydrolase [Serpentinicella sp. ANB-PHB4]MDR5658190.1 bifunctional 5,10-methylenetetrahydrofolate dehydrogenase/5,10-methenyltetrahydrofolate cyclohydrolase [Serpentinicella sp. ANB-PHB4]
MGAKIIDGKEIASEIIEEIKLHINQFKKDIRPGLAVVLVGDDEASRTYVDMKEKMCHYVGIHSRVIKLDSTITEKELLQVIQELNADTEIHGILVQLPLPKHINEFTINESILPQKDVDGFNPVNIGNLQLNRASFIPCTPKGIIQLLKKVGIEIEGKEALVVGRSNIVGKPTADLLLNENATVTICHSKSKDLQKLCLRSDIIISAVGSPGLITDDMIKDGTVIIDAGTSMIDGKLVGDVKYDLCYKKAGYITPVPGGVGPMTIAMLMKNTLKAAKEAEEAV